MKPLLLLGVLALLACPRAQASPPADSTWSITVVPGGLRAPDSVVVAFTCDAPSLSSCVVAIQEANSNTVVQALRVLAPGQSLRAPVACASNQTVRMVVTLFGRLSGFADGSPETDQKTETCPVKAAPRPSFTWGLTVVGGGS